MAINLTPKDPNERFDYLWSPPLDTGDAIDGAATVSVVSGTVTIAESVVDNQVKLIAEGGVAGETTIIEARVTTTGGRIFEETLYLRIVSSASPLAAELIMRFPAFAAVPTSTIAYWLTDAEKIVTSSWSDTDRDPAKMELAAHNMALNGLGTTSTGNIPAGVTSFRSGSFSVGLSEAAVKAQVAGGYSATRYGTMFARRLRRNVGVSHVMQGVLTC